MLYIGASIPIIYFVLMMVSLHQELIALSDVVGTESRGLSADMIASLPSINYKAQSTADDNIDP